MKIYQGDCLEVMSKLWCEYDLVVTSPPYNTSRRSNTEKSLKTNTSRYDISVESRTADEYAKWCADIFNSIDRILKDNGVIIWNVSYSSASSDYELEGVNSMWFSLAEIIKNTNFMIADEIIWKKKSALPNNISPNKLTRICEHVFIFCRKNEYKTFRSNKQVSSIRKTGQKNYKPIYNFIEAKNNDGSNPYNKATYSTELVLKLLEIYCQKDMKVLDPFLGTGTTLNACLEYGVDGDGIEMSENQVKYANERHGLPLNHFIKFIETKANLKITRISKEQLSNMKECDRASTSSGDEIVLGYYENKEEELIALFHEFGHIIKEKQINKEENVTFETMTTEQFKQQKIENEKWCWKFAFNFAKKYDVEITDSMKNYAMECLKTYLTNNKG